MEIAAIFGMETRREGEYPVCYMVGSPAPSNGARVERIEAETHNYGDHGIGWFNVYGPDGLIAAMQERAISEVHYKPAPPQKQE